MRLMDGQTEAFTINRFGMQGIDPYGNITLAFDRVRGSLDTTGVAQQHSQISVEAIRHSYADFCAQSTFAFAAAQKACEHDTEDLFSRFGITPPESQTSISSAAGRA